jgi:hypothetical protein
MMNETLCWVSDFGPYNCLLGRLNSTDLSCGTTDVVTLKTKSDDIRIEG